MLSDICLDFYELHTLYITITVAFYYRTKHRTYVILFYLSMSNGP